MKITIESTSRIVTVANSEPRGIDCRVWEGVTEHGVKVQVLISRIAAGIGENLEQFEAEFKEQRAPSAEVQAFPLRMIL